LDLSSRLRAIVKSGPPRAVRELTYEPDTGGYEATLDLARMGAILGGYSIETPFGRCLVVDRRYESDRWHGDIQIGDCDVSGDDGLRVLDPTLVGALDGRPPSRTVFIDLETTGLSGGAGTMAFLVGCGVFDLGAFQVRQFVLTSHAAERALLSAVAQFFEGADLIVTYNGKTFDVPVMETRWLFHRIQMPLDGVAHFDVLHPARRLWKDRAAFAWADRDHASAPKELAWDPTRSENGGCRLSTLERVLFGVRRVGDVDGFEIPGRFFQFVRSGNPHPLEPVLEHNRLDLLSLAAVMARAVRLARDGHDSCRDSAEALALGRIYERAGAHERAEACYRRAAGSDHADVKGEALYRIGLRYRRDRRFVEAAEVWRAVMTLTKGRGVRRHPSLVALRRFAAEALAIHHEHRERDLLSAREIALFALEEAEAGVQPADGIRHRIARLDLKLRKRDLKLERNDRKKKDAQQLSVLEGPSA
jgi:uncharacterized protein YprB with RNaseH-like and TPR domain